MSDNPGPKYVENLLAEITRLKDELTICKEVISDANNSLFGSHGFFLSLHGGEPNKYHLSNAIENLKALCNSSNAKLAAAMSTADAAFSAARTTARNDALDAAASAMNPMLRSMISRDQAAAAIRKLKEKKDG